MFEILLIIMIIISVAAIAGGYIMRYQAPKDEQMKMGFRTESAKASSEAWAYANRTCGKNWLTTGLIELFLGIPILFLMYYFKGEHSAQVLSFVYVIAEIIFLVIAVTSVQKEMKNKFDESGRLKENE